MSDRRHRSLLLVASVVVDLFIPDSAGWWTMDRSPAASTGGGARHHRLEPGKDQPDDPLGELLRLNGGVVRPPLDQPFVDAVQRSRDGADLERVRLAAERLGGGEDDGGDEDVLAGADLLELGGGRGEATASLSERVAPNIIELPEPGGCFVGDVTERRGTR
ncbi:MAG: hypothetical protein M3Q53_00190 [Actinomycetota bacterium]|nr:hypothetical protein [Actinomycetota bacterium]